MCPFRQEVDGLWLCLFFRVHRVVNHAMTASVCAAGSCFASCSGCLGGRSLEKHQGIRGVWWTLTLVLWCLQPKFLAHFGVNKECWSIIIQSNVEQGCSDQLCAASWDLDWCVEGWEWLDLELAVAPVVTAGQILSKAYPTWLCAKCLWSHKTPPRAIHHMYSHCYALGLRALFRIMLLLTVYNFLWHQRRGPR